MSQSVGKITLTRVPSGATYQAMITCSTGDAMQQYDSGSVYPNWELAANASLRPILRFRCVSSRQASGEVVPSTMEVYYDGVKLTFGSTPVDGWLLNTNSDSSIGLAAGMFGIKGGYDGATDQPWYLIILKNIADPTKPATLTGHTIRMVGNIAGEGNAPAELPIAISKATSSGVTVSIIGEGDNPFAVDQSTGATTTLKAQIFEKGVPVTNPTGASYQWHVWKKKGSSEQWADAPWAPASGEVVGWVKLSGKTAQSLVVAPDDVDAYAQYMVVVSYNGEKYSDTQDVQDLSDPFLVGIEINDESGAGASSEFAAGSAASSKRVLKAKLVSRSNATPPAITSCYWSIFAPDGAPLNSNFTGNKNAEGVAKSTYNTTLESDPNKNTLTIPFSFMTNFTSIDIVTTVNY